MTLRSKLTTTLFCLAVLPLTGTTVWSYVTSQRALRRAAEAEAASLAAEMTTRMEAVTADLGQKIERLTDVPFANLPRAFVPSKGEAPDLVLKRLEAELGSAVNLVDSLEFTPVPPGSPGAPAGPPAKPRGKHKPSPPSAFGPPASLWEKVLLQVESGPPPSDPAAERRHHWVWQHLPQKGAGAAEREQLLAAKIAVAKAERLTRALELETAHLADAARLTAGGATTKGGRGSKSAALDLGREFACKPAKHDKPVGHLRARLRVGEIAARVFAATRPAAGEIAFAIDPSGELHAPEHKRVYLAPLISDLKACAATVGEARKTVGNWVVVTRHDPATKMTWGIARPLGAALKEMRTAALRNFGGGLLVVCLALVGIVPLSRRMTRDLAVLSDGAERLARGDLEARVPVRTRDEIGRLGETFNRMATELRVQQVRLVEQERLRRELELCRRIQEEMLPRERLRFPFAEAKGLSIPAREVGGDFFNYFALPDGTAALLVGDVAGKGVPAALLMANVQATLRARLPLVHDLAALAVELDREIEANTPRPTYLTLFVGIVDGSRRLLRYVNAGQNPPILIRDGGETVRLDSTGRPLGLLPGGGYEERSLTIGEGDAFVLYTDGLVESENQAGEAFGLERLEAVLADARQDLLDSILTRIETAVRTHRAGAEPLDDSTVVVLRVGEAKA